ncbi:hypothetical protein EDB19DRAFT_1631834, partial [Suillus lakei]
DQIQFGEVQLYFQINFNESVKTLALVSLYSAPDYHILWESYNTLYSYTYQGDTVLVFVKVFTIPAVVAMVSHKLPNSQGLLPG